MYHRCLFPPMYACRPLSGDFLLFLPAPRSRPALGDAVPSLVRMLTYLVVAFSSNLEYWATFLLFSCILPLVGIFRRRYVSNRPCLDTGPSEESVIARENEDFTKGATGETSEGERDVQQLSKKPLSKKAQKRARKKKNKGQPKQQNKENMSLKSGQSQPSLEPEQQKARKRHTLGLPRVPTNQIRAVKLYAPLSMFVQLHMQLPELYSRLQPYVLKLEDLQNNGFPHYSPEDPEKVVSNSYFKIKDEPDDPTHRWCCRCGLKYIVSEDGVYQSETMCSYHGGKRFGAGPFSCCGSYTSDGCLTNAYHVSNSTVLRTVNYRKTRQKRQAPDQTAVYAIDCEMCYTIQGLEVTRVSMVGMDGLAIYDSYVLPESPITDYNTGYSGITANHLRDVKTTLADVQAVLLKHVSDRTILIGHGLDNDLKALHIVHESVVDTSVVFPHHFGLPYKRSLKSLAASFLKEKIQDGPQGHDSVEDARTCMELMLWKVDSDRQVFASPAWQPPPPTWQPVPPFNIHPLPHNIGFWVPPVGSSSDLY